MDPFVKKILQGSTTDVPGVVKDSLSKTFDYPLSIEWFRIAEGYEAIFYQDNIEHIARFSSSGELLDFRVNITSQSLPPSIRQTVATLGEIMNVVMINLNDRIEYEVISRDRELNRYLHHLTGNGTVVSSRRL